MRTYCIIGVMKEWCSQQMMLGVGTVGQITLYHIHTKINSRWVEYTNMKNETLK